MACFNHNLAPTPGLSLQTHNAKCGLLGCCQILTGAEALFFPVTLASSLWAQVASGSGSWFIGLGETTNYDLFKLCFANQLCSQNSISSVPLQALVCQFRRHQHAMVCINQQAPLCHRIAYCWSQVRSWEDIHVDIRTGRKAYYMF